jgi:hypothetical protein
VSYLDGLDLHIEVDMSNLKSALESAAASTAALLEAIAPDGRLPELYAGGLA